MSTVARSASVNLSQLLNTVGTAAHALSTTFNTLGTAASVLSVKSEDWLRDTRIASAANATAREAAIVDDVSIAIALRVNERDTQLNKNPSLKVAYERTLPIVQAAVDAALGRSPATAE